MRAAYRSLLGFCLLVAAACAAAPPPAPVGAQPKNLEIRSQPLVLKLDDPAQRRVGKLVWRGGISMTASSANFGGWSDLHVSPDGKSLSSISDEGSWLTATIDYDPDGNLVGLSNGRIGSLRGLDGKPLQSKVMSDAEGVALLPDGSWLVSFERHHRFWRYPTLDGTPTPIDGPADLGKQPNNGGVEAVTALADGRIVAISEEYEVKPGVLRGWIGQPAAGGRYTWQTFEYVKTPDFNPTAIRLLPDGSFVLLERAFDPARGVRVRVMQFSAAELRPGGTVQAQQLARLASPYAVDNLEGLSVGKGARGETLLWMISDDNFNPLQRNILLMFELEK
ncbi:MAG TPA: esterase-like activity of phytase family protein [Methylomirabilota bacterium]|nr:esterase-like activity of phytase family protein [Methylomirabilota bacterium]